MEEAKRSDRAATASSAAAAAESHIEDELESGDGSRSLLMQNSSSGTSAMRSTNSSGSFDNSSNGVKLGGNLSSSSSIDSRSSNSSEYSGSLHTSTAISSNFDIHGEPGIAATTATGVRNGVSSGSTRNSRSTAQDAPDTAFDADISAESEAAAADFDDFEAGSSPANNFYAATVAPVGAHDLPTAAGGPVTPAAAEDICFDAATEGTGAAETLDSGATAAEGTAPCGYPFDLEDEAYDVDTALGLHGATAATEVEEQQEQQQHQQNGQRQDHTRKAFHISAAGGGADGGSSCGDDATTLLPPHPCLPPPIISSLPQQQQQPSAAAAHSPARADGAAAPTRVEDLGPRQVGGTPATAAAASTAGARAAAGGRELAAAVEGRVLPRQARQEKEREQQVWQKVRHFLRGRHLQLQQLEVVGWLAWLRFVHREAMLVTRLIAAAALDAYLNFCYRKAAAAEAAAAATQHAPPHSASSTAAKCLRCCSRAPPHYRQQKNSTAGAEPPPAKQQQQAVMVEPRYPADGAAAFAFMKETFQVETLPNNHPFFLPLRRHPQQRHSAAAASAATAWQRRAAAAPAAAAAAGEVPHHPWRAAAAAARIADSAADAAYMAKLAVTRHHSMRHHQLRVNSSSSSIKGGGSDSSADSKTKSSGVRSCCSSSGSSSKCAEAASATPVRSHTGTSRVESDYYQGGRAAAVAASTAAAAASAGVRGLARSFGHLQQQKQLKRGPTDDPAHVVDFVAAAAARRRRSTGWPRSRLLAFGGGALRFRLLRAIERKRGTDAMLAIIFVALCRSLGLRARLVLSLPPLVAPARTPAAAPSLSPTAKLFLTQSASGGGGRSSSGAAVAAAAAAEVAGMSCCSEAPPQWLVRLFVHLGLPLPAFLRVQAEHYMSPGVLSSCSSSPDERLGAAQQKDRSTGGKRSGGSSSSNSSGLRASEERGTSRSSASSGGWDSTRAQAPDDEAAAAAATRAHVEEASEAATLRAAMCTMPQQLQVWGEYFCRQEERWIACTFFSSSRMIHDAADWLAGRAAADRGAEGAAATLGGAAPTGGPAPRKAAAAARLKHLSSRRLAAFLGVSPLFLDTPSPAAASVCGKAATEAGAAAGAANAPLVPTASLSKATRAALQGREAGFPAFDFLPTIRERLQPRQLQQQPTAEPPQSVVLPTDQLQGEKTGGKQQETEAQQACQQQGDKDRAMVHQDKSRDETREVPEEAAAAAAPQPGHVQLAQLLLFTRPRRRQQQQQPAAATNSSSAASDGGASADDGAAAGNRTAAGSCRGIPGAAAASRGSPLERARLPDSSSSSTAASDSGGGSPSSPTKEEEDPRGSQHRRLLQQRGTPPQQQQQQNLQPQQSQQQHGGCRSEPPKPLQLEQQDSQQGARDEERTAVAVPPPHAERGLRRAPKAKAVKDRSRSAFLRCFPVVVELPPLLFFFHSPNSLSLIVFPFSVGGAAAAAAERRGGSRTSTEAVQAAGDDYAEENKSSGGCAGRKCMRTVGSACSNKTERSGGAALCAAASFPSEGVYSLARGQVFSFTFRRFSPPAAAARSPTSSGLVAAHSLAAAAAAAESCLLQALQIRVESLASAPLPLSGAAAASRKGAAAAVLLVLLLLLKLLQVQGFLTPPPAVVDFVREAVTHALLGEAAAEADEDEKRNGGKYAAAGAGSPAVTTRGDARVSRQHLQQQQQQQQQPQVERTLRQSTFPFEVEEERYTLAAELSAAWRKAASSSSSYAAARRTRSARNSSSRRLVEQPLQQQHQQGPHSGGACSRSSSRSSRGRLSPSPAETLLNESRAVAAEPSSSNPATASSSLGLLNNSSSSSVAPLGSCDSTPSAGALVHRARWGGAAASRERLGIDFLMAAQQRRSRARVRCVSPVFCGKSPPSTAAILSDRPLLDTQDSAAADAGAPHLAAPSRVATATGTDAAYVAARACPPADAAADRGLAAAAGTGAGVAAAGVTAAKRACGVIGDRPTPAAAVGSTAPAAAEFSSAHTVIVIPSEDEEEKDPTIPHAAGGEGAPGPARTLPRQLPPPPAASAAAASAAAAAPCRSATAAAAGASPAAAGGPLAGEHQLFVLAIDETERITDVSFRYTHSWRRILEGRQRRLQHWWTSAGTQRLLLPKKQQLQQQETERRKRQKEQQEQQQQHSAEGPQGEQRKMRRRDEALCTGEAAAAGLKETEELQVGRRSSSSERSLPKSSSSGSSEEEAKEEDEEAEEEQEQRPTEAEEDFIVFEDEDVVRRADVPQEEEQQRNLTNAGGEGAAPKHEEQARVSRRTDVGRGVSGAADRSDSGAAAAAAAEQVLEKPEKAISWLGEGEAAKGKAEEQQQEEEEACRKAEERERQELLAREPLPTSRAGFKLHPKFVLSSDLKPFEYIPPGTRPAAFFNGELVFLRDDIKILKSERQWLRLRRKIKAGQGPLRVITRRIPQLPPAAGGGRRAQQWLNPVLQQLQEMEENREAKKSSGNCAAAAAGNRERVGLYAEWQTEMLPPLRVENGVLPVNERGNIEVGKLGAVPIGAVHISLEDFRCEGDERSNSRLGGGDRSSSSSSSGSRKQRTCLSVGSLGGALTAAAAACGVQWAPAVVGFELDTKRQLHQQARWVVQRDGIVVLESDEARVRQKWAEERIRREKTWEQRRERREQRDREEAAMRWRVLCRALLYWRDQHQREQQQQGD